MKYSFTLLFALLLFSSCVDKNPELNEEDYRLAQQEYEKMKAEIDGGNEAFFTEHKNEVFNKINLFKRLKDSTNVFENVNKKEGFYLENVKLQAINFKIGNIDGEKVIFLPKNKTGKSLFNYKLSEPYEALYYCEKHEEKCSHLKAEVLQEFIDIKYVFVLNGYRVLEPKIIDGSSFQSGLFIGDITVYDIDADKPIYNYVINASNNDEVSYASFGNDNKMLTDLYLQNDFNDNIYKSIVEATEKHFNFSE